MTESGGEIVLTKNARFVEATRKTYGDRTCHNSPQSPPSLLKLPTLLPHYISKPKFSGDTELKQRHTIETKTEHHTNITIKMHSSKKSSTPTTQACNQAILSHKHNSRKSGKSKKRSSSSTVAVKSVLCLATAVFSSNIPVTLGFGISQLEGGLGSVSQSKSSNRRRQNYVATSRSHLQYRSHENNEEQQCQHEKATSELLKKIQPNHQVSNFIHTWWTSAKSKRAIEEAAKDNLNQGNQLVLDNYLESIDRRYKRLHKHDKANADVGVNTDALRSIGIGSSKRFTSRKQKKQNSAVTSAWQFLVQHEPSSASEEQRKQEDAIYVLGLANLASKRLLQKHQLPIPSSKQHQSASMVIDVDIQAAPANANANPTRPITQEHQDQDKAVANAIQSQASQDAVRSVALSALLCIQFLKSMQAAHFSLIAALSIKVKTYALGSMKGGSKASTVAFRTIANFTGGKHTMQFFSIFAATLMAAALSMVRPLSRA